MADIPIWQYVVSSVLVPLLIGLGGAWLGHSLSLRKTRLEARMLERRTTYEQLVPALSDLAAYDSRALRLLYGEYSSQAALDHERESDEQWALRRQASIDIVQGVLARGQLAASKQILEMLRSYMDERMRISGSMHPNDFADGLEKMAEASREAWEAVSSVVAREV